MSTKVVHGYTVCDTKTRNWCNDISPKSMTIHFVDSRYSKAHVELRNEIMRENIKKLVKWVLPFGSNDVISVVSEFKHGWQTVILSQVHGTVSYRLLHVIRMWEFAQVVFDAVPVNNLTARVTKYFKSLRIKHVRTSLRFKLKTVLCMKRRTRRSNEDTFNNTVV